MNEPISSEELEKMLLHPQEIKTCPKCIPEIRNIIDEKTNDQTDIPPDLPENIIDEISKDANEILSSIVMTRETVNMYMFWYEWILSKIENTSITIPSMKNQKAYCHMDIYGSFRTGLITNNGDLDCTLMLLQNPFSNICQLYNGIPCIPCNNIVDISGSSQEENMTNVSIILKKLKEKLELEGIKDCYLVRNDEEDDDPTIPKVHFTRSTPSASTIIIKRSEDEKEEINIVDIGPIKPLRARAAPQDHMDGTKEQATAGPGKASEGGEGSRIETKQLSNLNGNQLELNELKKETESSKTEVPKRTGRIPPEEGYIKVSVINAHISILQFQYIQNNSGISIKIELSINNLIPFVNTSYLLYSRQVECNHFSSLAIIIKHWAKQRQISSPSNSQLAPYAFTLLVLYYLQTRDVSAHSLDEYSIGAIIYGFFRFYAYEWMKLINRYIISVNINNVPNVSAINRLGGVGRIGITGSERRFLVTRKSKGWGIYVSSEYIGDIKCNVGDIDKYSYFNRILPGIIPSSYVFKCYKRRDIVKLDSDEEDIHVVGDTARTAMDPVESDDGSVISMRPNVPSSIPADGAPCEYKNESHFFPISDPFEPDRDLGMILINKTYMLTMAEFRRSVGILRRGKPSASKSWRSRKDFGGSSSSSSIENNVFGLKRIVLDPGIDPHRSELKRIECAKAKHEIMTYISETPLGNTETSTGGTTTGSQNTPPSKGASALFSTPTPFDKHSPGQPSTPSSRRPDSQSKPPPRDDVAHYDKGRREQGSFRSERPERYPVSGRRYEYEQRRPRDQYQSQTPQARPSDRTEELKVNDTDVIDLGTDTQSCQQQQQQPTQPEKTSDNEVGVTEHSPAVVQHPETRARPEEDQRRDSQWKRDRRGLGEQRDQREQRGLGGARGPRDDRAVGNQVQKGKFGPNSRGPSDTTRQQQQQGAGSTSTRTTTYNAAKSEDANTNAAEGRPTQTTDEKPSKPTEPTKEATESHPSEAADTAVELNQTKPLLGPDTTRDNTTIGANDVESVPSSSAVNVEPKTAEPSGEKGGYHGREKLGGSAVNEARGESERYRRPQYQQRWTKGDSPDSRNPRGQPWSSRDTTTDNNNTNNTNSKSGWYTRHDLRNEARRDVPQRDTQGPFRNDTDESRRYRPGRGQYMGRQPTRYQARERPAEGANDTNGHTD